MNTYDIIGIGIGPFNLGMAALAEPLDLNTVFLDGRDGFCWHPGMMFDDATIQVPFMADLVTMADPTSRFSFLNYLKQQGRIYPFYIRESFYPLRREYSNYCAWAADQLPNLEWNSPVEQVTRADGLWEVRIGGPNPRTYRARHIVNGTGTQPHVPEPLQPALQQPRAWHSSEFLPHLTDIRAAESVTIIGSGQSAAEIYRHLMEGSAADGKRLDWFTRSPRFFPMEYTALTLELTSPDYARHFHGLEETRRDQLNRQQRNLYKGISGDLVDDIYDTLYRLHTTGGLRGDLRPGAEVSYAGYDQAAGQHQLSVRDSETGRTGTHATEAVILATGYGRPDIPPHLADIAEINRDTSGRMAVSENFSVNDAGDLFVLNAEEHTHSLNAPDLGMGPWRNSIILNQICGRDVYAVEHSTVFQTFGGRGL